MQKTQENPIQRILVQAPDLTLLHSYPQYQRKLCQHTKNRANTRNVNLGFALTP